MHPHFYSQHDEAAVSHLFEVASGLDSAVIGETEILGQVRDAWDLARIEQTSRTTLNMLFRQALEVGKRARNETGISKSTTSISHAAVEMAKDELGHIRKWRYSTRTMRSSMRPWAASLLLPSTPRPVFLSWL